MASPPPSDLIVMPGRDRATADEMASLVRMADREAPVVAYGFWAEDSDGPDLEAEISALVRRSPAYVVAKSIGSLIAMLAQRDHHLPLRGAVFLGVPVKRLRHDGRVDLIVDHCRRTPTLILQRHGDPTGAFHDLTQALGASATAVLHELPGDTHRYADHEVAGVLNAWWRALKAH